MRHRLFLPTMVLAFKDNHHAATTIPEGTVLDVAGAGFDDRFVVVTFNGEQFHMFASDLTERSKPVRVASA